MASSIPTIDLWQTRDYTFSVSDKSSTLTAKVQPTVFLGSLLYKHSELFILYTFLRCVISFQITKPGNVESIEEKKFIGIFETTKVFFTRKFPGLWYLSKRHDFPLRCHQKQSQRTYIIHEEHAHRPPQTTL